MPSKYLTWHEDSRVVEPLVSGKMKSHFQAAVVPCNNEYYLQETEDLDNIH